jgi:hypothetical protein
MLVHMCHGVILDPTPICRRWGSCVLLPRARLLIARLLAVVLHFDVCPSS